MSVVTLHPIILTVTSPPGVPGPYPPWARKTGHVLLGVVVAAFAAVPLRASLSLLSPAELVGLLLFGAALYRWHEEIYRGITRAVIAASAGNRRWIGAGVTVVLFVVCPMFGWRLRVGDMTPGSALLFPEHEYNVAYAKLNEKFLGANQLVVIADTGKPDGMKDAEPLTIIEEFADHMEAAPGAGVSVTVIDIVKQLARLFHEGEPKWGFVPDQKKYIAELFFQFTQSGQAGDLDRFLSGDARYGTVVTLSTSTRTTSSRAIARGKEWAAANSGEHVRFLFAGGLFRRPRGGERGGEDSTG